MKILIIPTLTLISFVSFSQERVIIKYETPPIVDLISTYKAAQKNKKILVYRIQLSSNESPENIRWLKNKYLKLFPKENVEEVFEPPYFKAITGSYLDKKKAEKKLLEIKSTFKSSFIFQEKISMKKYKEDNTINY